MNNNDLSFRWLGVAGLEIVYKNQTILIDPYLTRIPFINLWFGKIIPNESIILRNIHKSDYILITHPHFDHLLDVPEILNNIGGLAIGSSNASEILGLHGISSERRIIIQPGSPIRLQEFEISVKDVIHIKAPGYGYGKLKNSVSIPMKARHYRMDVCYQYSIRTGNKVIQTDTGKSGFYKDDADILFINPLKTTRLLQKIFKEIRPKNVVFIHWDNLFRPLSKPLKPYYIPPDGFPYLPKKADLERSAGMIQEITGNTTKVLIPKLLQWYFLNNEDIIEE
jgi:L-ascorbate metabolism protein UlaG (beta-lactamase superfamily)